jgi:hypothetical protein
LFLEIRRKEFGLGPKWRSRAISMFGGAKIVEDLPWGGFVKVVCGLCLHDQPVVDNHVYALLSELLAFVPYANTHFSSHTMTTRQELALESHDAYVLEESKAEGVVDVVERTDDRLGQLPIDEVAFHGATITSNVDDRTIIRSQSASVS